MKTVELADNALVTKYEYQMGVVLGILDHTEALVTDLSTVGDFVDTGDIELDLARLAELSDIFNTKVSLSTPLWELAKSICWEESLEVDDVKEQG